MDLTHRFTVPASIDETWAAFNHPELITPCFPGATLSSVEGNEFFGEMKVKLGPIALVYDGSGRFVERNRTALRTVIQANGKDKRGKGSASATVTTSFLANGSGTIVHVVTDLALTGKPAQFGRGVVDDVSERLLDQFASCVSDKFADGLGAAAAEAGDPSLLGASPYGASSYHYRPPTAAGQTDFEKFTTFGPVLAKRVGPPLLGGLALLWLVRKLRKPSG